jgi:hypothetical protein
MPKTTPTARPELDATARPELDATAQAELLDLILKSSAPRDALNLWVEHAAQAADFLADMADGNNHASKFGVCMPELYGPSVTAQAALIGFAVRVVGTLADCVDRQHTAAREAAV